MRQPPHLPEVFLLLLPLALAACASPRGTAPQATVAGDPAPRRAAEPKVRVVQPGAPGEPSRLLTPVELGEIGPLPYTEADVRFMQGMIPHHAQALDMAALVEDRTRTQEIRLLARPA